MSLWTCPEHGLYGGDVFCPKCEAVGAYTTTTGVSASRPGYSAEPEPVPVSAASAVSIPDAWGALKAAARNDPEWAWALFCNLSVPIMDATGISPKKADQAGAYLMSHLFECDITTHPYFKYEKSGAQAYQELRIAADRAEDARG